MTLIDTNVSLFHWPFRRWPADDADELVKILKRHGVMQAWAGSFEGVLHKDIAGVNTRLAHACHKHGHGILAPFGSVNPTLPDWEDDLRRCAEEHKMRGIRLHPNYHGYKLDDPLFARLLELAAARNFIVQIAVGMEDMRTQHPLMRVPDVDVAPLPALLKSHPHLHVMLLNCFRSLKGDARAKMATVENLSFEISTLEEVGGISTLLARIPVERVLFGSGAPFFYFDSALLKLKESPLTDAQLSRIRHENARKISGA
jgi:predicted TIM-barrel fold metal-dependent hydrolase